MKLPRIQSGAVQSFAKPDIAAPYREADAFARMGAQLGTAFEKGREAYSRAELMNAWEGVGSELSTTHSAVTSQPELNVNDAATIEALGIKSGDYDQFKDANGVVPSYMVAGDVMQRKYKELQKRGEELKTFEAQQEYQIRLNQSFAKASQDLDKYVEKQARSYLNLAASSQIQAGIDTLDPNLIVDAHNNLWDANYYETREDFENAFTESMNDFGEAVKGQYNEDFAMQATEAFQFARKGEFGKAIESYEEIQADTQGMVEDGIITPLEGQEKLQSAYNEIVAQESMFHVEDIFRTHGSNASLRYINQNISDIPEGFTPDEWEKEIAKMQTLHGWMEKTTLDEVKGSNYEMMITSGILPDPLDKDYRSYVNQVYGQAIQLGNDPMSSGTEVMQRYGIVPDVWQGLMRGANRGDSGNLEMGVNMYIAANKFAPRALEDMKNKKEINVLQQVANQVELGIPMVDAIEYARKMEAMTLSDREAFQKDAREIEENNILALEDYVKDAMPEYMSLMDTALNYIPFTDFSPVIPRRMQAAYDAEVMVQYANTGGRLELSQKIAYDNMSSRFTPTNFNNAAGWGPSVGGYEFMENAPVGDVSLFRKELGQFVSTESDGRYTEEQAQQAIIQSDSITRFNKANGETLSYRVILPEEDGLETIMLERFQWNPSEAMDRKIQEDFDVERDYGTSKWSAISAQTVKSLAERSAKRGTEMAERERDKEQRKAEMEARAPLITEGFRSTLGFQGELGIGF